MLHTIIGLFISNIYSYYVLPKNENSDPNIKPTLYPIIYNGMIIIPFNKYNAIHIHHWSIYMLICILSFYIYIPNIIFGFSIGLSIQGLMYSDRFKFICRNPYYTNIYNLENLKWEKNPKNKINFI
jgi:hypothetical protein